MVSPRKPTTTTETAVLHALVQGVTSDISEIKGTLKEMGDAISKLATVEKTQSDQSTAILRLSDRLVPIEVAMPGLKELRKWVIGGVLAVVMAVGTALVGLVLVPRPIPTYIVASPQIAAPVLTPAP